MNLTELVKKVREGAGTLQTSEVKLRAFGSGDVIDALYTLAALPLAGSQTFREFDFGERKIGNLYVCIVPTTTLVGHLVDYFENKEVRLPHAESFWDPLLQLFGIVNGTQLNSEYLMTHRKVPRKIEFFSGLEGQMQYEEPYNLIAVGQNARDSAGRVGKEMTNIYGDKHTIHQLRDAVVADPEVASVVFREIFDAIPLARYTGDNIFVDVKKVEEKSFQEMVQPYQR